MDEKIMDYIPAFRVTRSMKKGLDSAANGLSMPRAQIIRLAIMTGLPLLMKQIQTPTTDQTQEQIK